MIVFKKTVTPPAPAESEENRFDQVRKAAQDGHQKAETETTRRRAVKKPEDDRLL